MVIMMKNIKNDYDSNDWTGMVLLGFWGEGMVLDLYVLVYGKNVLVLLYHVSKVPTSQRQPCELVLLIRFSVRCFCCCRCC